MTIIRRRHNGKFTSISNAIFKDPRLSAEAKGTLGYLMTMPHDWRVKVDKVGEAMNMGRDKTQRVFQELIAAGYATRNVSRSQNGGLWQGVEYDIKDDPQDGDDVTFLPQPDFQAAVEGGATSCPQPGKPSPRKPSPRKPSPRYPVTATKKEESTKDEEETKDDRTKNIKHAPRGALMDDLFAEKKPVDDQLAVMPTSAPPNDGWPPDYDQQFRRLYPRKENMKQAVERLGRIRKSGTVSWATIIAGIENLKGRELKYTPHPSTWLNNARWEDEPIKPKPSTGYEPGII